MRVSPRCVQAQAFPQLRSSHRSSQRSMLFCTPSTRSPRGCPRPLSRDHAVRVPSPRHSGRSRRAPRRRGERGEATISREQLGVVELALVNEHVAVRVRRHPQRALPDMLPDPRPGNAGEIAAYLRERSELLARRKGRLRDKSTSGRSSSMRKVATRHARGKRRQWPATAKVSRSSSRRSTRLLLSSAPNSSGVVTQVEGVG